MSLCSKKWIQLKTRLLRLVLEGMDALLEFETLLNVVAISDRVAVTLK